MVASLRAQDRRRASQGGARRARRRHRRLRAGDRRRRSCSASTSWPTNERRRPAVRQRAPAPDRRPRSTCCAGASTTTRFDAAIFSLDAVAADLGYGDVRRCRARSPGSTACAREGKRIAVVAGRRARLGRARARRDRRSLRRRRLRLRTPSAASCARWRSSASSPTAPIVVGVDAAATSRRRAPRSVELAIGVARGTATPEQLRRAGAVAVVADLQELLGPTSG